MFFGLKLWENDRNIPFSNETEGKLRWYTRKLHYPCQSRLVNYECLELIKIGPTQSKIYSRQIFMHRSKKLIYDQKIHSEHMSGPHLHGISSDMRKFCSVNKNVRWLQLIYKVIWETFEILKENVALLFLFSRATRSGPTLVLPFFQSIYLSVTSHLVNCNLSVRPREFSRKMHRKPKSHMFNQITHSTLS